MSGNTQFIFPVFHSYKITYFTFITNLWKRYSLVMKLINSDTHSCTHSLASFAIWNYIKTWVQILTTIVHNNTTMEMHNFLFKLPVSFSSSLSFFFTQSRTPDTYRVFVIPWMVLFLWVPIFVNWTKKTLLLGSKFVVIVFSFIIYTGKH